jgi:hypothetical protein
MQAAFLVLVGVQEAGDCRLVVVEDDSAAHALPPHLVDRTGVEADQVRDGLLQSLYGLRDQSGNHRLAEFLQFSGNIRPRRL